MPHYIGDTTFGVFTGKEFMELEIEKRKFLVDEIIRERDSVILVGNEKSGKSVLVQQLTCSLTAQTPFIDKWEVNKPCKVTYIQLEGELSDTKDRFSRMLTTLDLNEENLQYMYLPPLELQRTGGDFGVEWLIKQIQSYHKPDLVIIDPVYFAFTGSLSDDSIVRTFIGNIRRLKNQLDCAMILVHHTHKTRFNVKGEVIMEGDEAIFGSKFFKAWADHILLFVYNSQTMLRTIYCNTQRSGDIIKQCKLKLIQPEPLYFKQADDEEETKEHIILNLLMQPGYEKGLTFEQISDIIDIKKSTFYISMKRLLKDKVVSKTLGRPVLYSYRGTKSVPLKNLV